MIYGRLIHLSGIDADADTVWDWLGRPILDVKVDAVAADEEKQRVLLISSGHGLVQSVINERSPLYVYRQLWLTTTFWFEHLIWLKNTHYIGYANL